MAKTEVEMAREGEFLREYGKQYFVVAVEALNIGRVKWSMVPIGKKGQDELTFYMPVEKMLALCLLFQDGTAQKKIAADTNSYPSAFHYVTGEDGSKILNIGGGKVGCRINIQDKSKTKNYIMAVSLESLETMARKFLMCTGYMSPAPGSYYESVIQSFEKGRAARAQYKHNVSAADLEEPTAGIPEETPSIPPVKNPEPTKKPVDPADIKEYTLKIQGEKKAQKTFWRFEGMLGDEAVSLLFNQNDVKNIKWFPDFEQAAKRENGTEITIMAEKKDKFLLFHE